MATATSSTPLARLQAQGQSVWIDFMSRSFVRDGELKRLIEADGLQGATSNPTIFEKAIGTGTDYDADVSRLVSEGADVDAIYQDLAVADIQAALDLFRPVYDRTNGLDGYVSLEVSPTLAFDADGTTREARHYWDLLARPNTMIKIPGTAACLPAIEECLARGININVTLLFSVEAYQAVARAYINALSRRAEAGLELDHVASVASFFVSRIDTEVDARLASLASADPARAAVIGGLAGQAAIANAKLAYMAYEHLFGSAEFQALRTRGARPQRLLWASVGTKNPKYSDTLYIDELIGPDTVSTMPPATYEAFKDHGLIVEEPTLTRDYVGARRLFAELAAAGVDLGEVTDLLLKQGVDSFAKSFQTLLGAIASKREKLLTAGG